MCNYVPETLVGSAGHISLIPALRRQKQVDLVKRRWMHRVQLKSIRGRGGKRHPALMEQQRKMEFLQNCSAAQLAYGSQLLFLMKLKLTLVSPMSG